MASGGGGRSLDCCSSLPEVAQFLQASQPQTDPLIEERVMFSAAAAPYQDPQQPDDDNLITTFQLSRPLGRHRDVHADVSNKI